MLAISHMLLPIENKPFSIFQQREFNMVLDERAEKLNKGW